MSVEISPAEHLDYLVSSIRLMLWFTWHSIDEHPEETFVDTIQKRTDIWRRTSLNPSYLATTGIQDKFESPEWRELLRILEDLYIRNRREGSAQGFEDESIAFLMSYLSPRVERDLKDIQNKIELGSFQCGSLKYNKEPNPNCPRRIEFHIGNACYPASPFDDPLHFPRCFMDLINQCEDKFNVTEIGTGTWMNSAARWMKLFPQEWQENLGPPNYDVRGHYGFWGQFMTGRKTFNHKMGYRFRETGHIPFPSRYSWCTIEAMRSHLRFLNDVDRNNM